MVGKTWIILLWLSISSQRCDIFSAAEDRALATEDECDYPPDKRVGRSISVMSSLAIYALRPKLNLGIAFTSSTLLYLACCRTAVHSMVKCYGSDLAESQIIYTSFSWIIDSSYCWDIQWTKGCICGRHAWHNLKDSCELRWPQNACRKLIDLNDMLSRGRLSALTPNFEKLCWFPTRNLRCTKGRHVELTDFYRNNQHMQTITNHLKEFTIQKWGDKRNREMFEIS